MSLPQSERHYTELPQANIRRSKFNRPQSYKGTCNASDIIPVYVDTDIMPGDTVSLDMGAVIRMTTPLFPTMDNAFVDFVAFFCPHRLIWNHWREFWGENNSTYWEQPITYNVPYTTSPSGGWDKGSLADYMGIPTKVDDLKVNSLAFRAYCKIYEDWWRDENLKQPAFYNIDDSNLTGKNVDGNYDPITYTQLGAAPLKAAKFHDRFTSSLPAPQKGPSVQVPLGTNAPVYTDYVDNKSKIKAPLNWAYNNGTEWKIYGSSAETSVGIKASTNNSYTYPETGSPGYMLAPNNLLVDLSAATSATINQLRQAYAVQRYLEAIARSGSRYIEIIKGVFGITSPDARLQRSEYLWGVRWPINIDQVLQTSSTDAVSPQGNTAAYSCTVSGEKAFTKSFTEHGSLIIVMVIRHHISYQQGLNPMWSRRKRTDWYVPQFANLGEMPVYNREIYAQGDSAINPISGKPYDEEVFGYQEAWSELRYNTDIVVGALRSNYATTLDSWHYADYYTTLPTLGSTWIDATEKNIDRTLAVPSSTEDQFIFDIFFDFNYTRPLPMYSIPQISDHY